jgi:hypothetical protein
MYVVKLLIVTDEAQIHTHRDNNTTETKKEEQKWSYDKKQVNVEDEHSIGLKTATELAVQLGMKTKNV